MILWLFDDIRTFFLLDKWQERRILQISSYHEWCLERQASQGVMNHVAKCIQCVFIESRASRCSGQDLPRGTSWPGKGVFAPFKSCSLHPSLRTTCLISASLSYYSLAECIVLSGRSLCRGVLRPMNQNESDKDTDDTYLLETNHWISLNRPSTGSPLEATDRCGCAGHLFPCEAPGSWGGQIPYLCRFSKDMLVILCIFCICVLNV
jgi:hypothetical protein